MIEAILQRFEIGLGFGHLEVGEQLGAEADEVEPSPQEIAGGTKASRVDVGAGEVSAAQELGDLPGVELVALGLQAVNRAHAEGVAESEGKPLALAEIGEPVPGEETLAADDEIAIAKRRQRGKESLGPTGKIAVEERLAVAVEDADIHRPRVKIDAAAQLVGPGVQSHTVPPLEGFFDILKATVWVAPKEARMSFNSFERTRLAAASGCAGQQQWRAAQFVIR